MVIVPVRHYPDLCIDPNTLLVEHDRERLLAGHVDFLDGPNGLVDHGLVLVEIGEPDVDLVLRGQDLSRTLGQRAAVAVVDGLKIAFDLAVENGCGLDALVLEDEATFTLGVAGGVGGDFPVVVNDGLVAQSDIDNIAGAGEGS